MYQFKKSPYKRAWTKSMGESSKLPSQTVPGDAYTIQQLFDRAQGGIPIDASVKIHPGYYDDNADFDTFVPPPDFDLVDAENLARESQEIISEAKLKLKQVKGQKKDPQATIKEDGTTTIKEPVDTTPDPEQKAPE